MGTKLCTGLLATLMVGVSATPDVVLATFDGVDKTTTFQWVVSNDNVMGGSSTSTFVNSNSTGVFNGTCAIVKYLNAPGNAAVHTSASQELPSTSFHSAASAVGGTFDLMLRSSKPAYKGFFAGWSAEGIPIKPQYGHGTGSFKAPFQLADHTDWQLVQIPMSAFSDDWSPFTGHCETKDPTGKQHHCCGAGDAAQYCPTATFLSGLTDIAIWAEGVAGDFHIELKWVGASNAAR